MLNYTGYVTTETREKNGTFSAPEELFDKIVETLANAGWEFDTITEEWVAPADLVTPQTQAAIERGIARAEGEDRC